MMPFAPNHDGKVFRPGTLSEAEGYERVDFSRHPVHFFAAELGDCEPHWHDACELIYVLAGGFQVRINNHCVDLGKGGMIYINGGDIHSLHATSGAAQLLTLQMSPAIQQAGGDKRALRFSLSAASTQPDDRAVLRAMLTLIRDELSEPRRSPFRTLSQVFDVLAALEEAQKGPAFTIEGDVERGDQRLIREAIDYVNQNYTEELTLQDLADHFGINYHRMSRVFKQVSRSNFKEYLTFLRVNRARQLLVDTDIPITDISQRSGFGDHKQLIQAMQKHCGVTPSQYRKALQPGPLSQQTLIQSLKLDRRFVANLLLELNSA